MANVESNWLLNSLQLLSASSALVNTLYITCVVILVLTFGWLGIKILFTIFDRFFNKLAALTPESAEHILRHSGLHRTFSRLIVGGAIFVTVTPSRVGIEWLGVTIHKAATLYLVVCTLLLFNLIVDIAKVQFNRSSMAKQLSVDAFFQVAKLIAAVIASIIIIAVLINQSPVYILSGLGALTAVLLIVFKDTLLGLMAGFQLAANRMIRNGDWIELPQYGADGTVEEVGLTSVKIKNWDNTISTVPTYELVNKPVKNWRGMEESSGRRIKRSLFISVHSVRFLSDDEILNLSKLMPLKAYVEEKQVALTASNSALCDSDTLNKRRLTNIGTYRAYLEYYLRHHPMINQDMTLMVRQLEPTSTGIPLQVYCFSLEKSWVPYEQIQSDIFDHFISMMASFDLKAYQNITDIHPQSQR